MSGYRTEQIHNIGFFGHNGVGKTTLLDTILFNLGLVKRRGSVDQGNSALDYDPDEVKRRMTINMSLVHLTWKDNLLNLIDTPGYLEFVGEVISALRVVEGAVIVVCASSGIQVGTEAVWEEAVKRQVPRMIFVNRMDRENANFYKVVEEAQEIFGKAVVPLQLPIGKEADFRGVVSLRWRKAYLYDENGKATETEIPAEMADQVEEWREQLIERIAETDDALIEKYLEGEPLTEEEIRDGMRAAIRSGNLIPVFVGSAAKNVGLDLLLDGILDTFPSAARVEAEAEDLASGETVALKAESTGPLAALAFKTLADPYVGRLTYLRVYSGTLSSDTRVFNPNKGQEERIGQLFKIQGKEQVPVQHLVAGDIGAVAKLSATVTGDTLCDKDRPLKLPGIEFPHPTFTYALKPRRKQDLDKLSDALTRIMEEDPTLHTEREPQTGEFLLSGMGESHLQIIAERMKRKFDVEVDLEIPRIPYRETIRKRAVAAYRHKKQTGGRGQFAEVHIELTPLPVHGDEEAFEFVDSIVGGVVPRQFIPSVEKGVRKAMQAGVVAGYPVVGVKVNLFDGKDHPVDSSDIAFQIAASQAFKKGMAEADPVLLEPIYELEVIVPDEFVGDVMGDFNARRGRVLGMEPVGGGRTRIRAQVPLAECQRYATDLRSMTQGRGRFSMRFDHYEEVPSHLAEKIIEEARARAEEEG